jgi:hypothetical protein
MNGYLRQLALPAVVKRRLFHVSFVSFGKPLLKTFSFSSENKSSAYLSLFSLFRAASAFLDFRLGTYHA